MTVKHINTDVADSRAEDTDESRPDAPDAKQPDAGVPAATKKTTKVTEDLPCTLNDVEWQNRAREMAQASKSVDEAMARKKAITSQAGSDVKTAEARRDKLVDIVSTRTEMREVTVEQVYDYEAGTVTRKRTDTGEVLSVRDMIDAERQGQLIDADQFVADARAAERDDDDESSAEPDLADEDLDDEED